jgi:hypothetical protein
LDSIATWTSGEPVSFSTVLCSVMIVVFCSVVSATNSPLNQCGVARGLGHEGKLHTAGTPGVMTRLPAAAPYLESTRPECPAPGAADPQVS